VLNTSSLKEVQSILESARKGRRAGKQVEGRKKLAEFMEKYKEYRKGYVKNIQFDPAGNNFGKMFIMYRRH
jgi:hypothetical protein